MLPSAIVVVLVPESPLKLTDPPFWPSWPAVPPVPFLPLPILRYLQVVVLPRVTQPFWAWLAKVLTPKRANTTANNEIIITFGVNFLLKLAIEAVFCALEAPFVFFFIVFPFFTDLPFFTARPYVL
jgi:hypothetical protein